MTVLSACEGAREPGILAPVEGFAGLVAGDEPRAVTIGRDVIGNGGTAADAAVAMYFAMTVTLPSRVGLAGGGVCIAHNSGLGYQEGEPSVQVFQFLPDPAAGGRPQLAGARAMAVMHARHGAQRWPLLLGPAERLGRVGYGVSRAFASDIAAAADFVSANPDLRGVYSNRSGSLAREGDEIMPSELAGVISGLRRQGAGYLYSGAFATRLVEAANGIGVPLTVQQLRDTLPRAPPPGGFPIADRAPYSPPPGGGAGLLTAQMVAMLTEVESYGSASPADRVHLLAEAGQRAFAARSGWLGSGTDGSGLVGEDAVERLMAGYTSRQHTPAQASAANALPAVSNPFTAGFVVADQWSSAVACSFTMNGLFGAGRMIPGTGILLPKDPTLGADNLAAAIISNPFNGTLYFAGTASGGLAAPAALTRVMLESLNDRDDLEAAVAAPRVVNVGAPDVTYYEPSLDAGIVNALSQRGHSLQVEPGVGLANALLCPGGLRNETDSCQAASDRRGHGLAVRVQ
ncbi:gamma-glutamyltransferase [Pelagibius marinus]|uniref:gamma-glutamyltransferase n=1 Tax=Pelagibius marinus TaxID=2762760 RepID=UPI001872D9CE|nr:gamma-glutamyltransferase [Pelagibius marinus]